MLISTRLRQLRKEHGVTLKTVAENTGLSISYISDIERGRTMPSLETVATFCRYYGLTLAGFFYGITISPPAFPGGANLIAVIESETK